MECGVASKDWSHPPDSNRRPTDYDVAGISDVRPHDARRSLATAISPHVSIAVLRDMLGHKTLAMANRYARQADAATLTQAAELAATIQGEGMAGQR